MTASMVSGLICMRCGRRWGRGLDGPCPRCGPEGVLDIEFDLGRARRTLTRRALASRPRDLWRYHELLYYLVWREIKARYKLLVKRHHPDANGGDRSLEDRLREVIQAYSYLKSVGFC